MPDTHALTVVHIPHASQVIPADVRATFVVSPETLATELLRMTDHFDELFFLPPELATSVEFSVSLLVVDPGRFPDDAVESMAAKGMGAVYTRTSDGAPLRSLRFSAGERAKLMARYYEPHHQRLSDAVAAVLAARDRCLLIDGQSFAATPYPHEPDQSPRRPDICIGTDEYHTPATGQTHGVHFLHFRYRPNTEFFRPQAATLLTLPVRFTDTCRKGVTTSGSELVR
jgi:N-formylglutamate deformylase